MQKNCVIIENVRSAYNVGNIIRTADALGWDVCISGYSPHPARDEKVVKSSLGAESTVACKDFRNPYEALQYYKKQ